MAALGFGFPVAFALPDSGMIGLAAILGYCCLVMQSFSSDSPVEWLSAGIMNFRNLL